MRTGACGTDRFLFRAGWWQWINGQVGAQFIQCIDMFCVLILFFSLAPTASNEPPQIYFNLFFFKKTCVCVLCSLLAIQHVSIYRWVELSALVCFYFYFLNFNWPVYKRRTEEESGEDAAMLNPKIKNIDV